MSCHKGLWNLCCGDDDDPPCHTLDQSKQSGKTQHGFWGGGGEHSLLMLLFFALKAQTLSPRMHRALLNKNLMLFVT